MFGIMFAVVGCSGVSLEGTLVDGLTGAPVPGPKTLTAKATTPDTSMGCQFLTGEVGADGHFSVPGLCGGTAYELVLDDDDWWLADGAAVPEGGWPGRHELQAWRVPKGAGLYVRSADGELTELKTAADWKSEKLLESDTKVRYPSEVIDEHVALLKAGDHLVMVGRNVVDEMKFLAVVPSGPRRFDGGKGPAGNPYTINMQAWMYLSTRFVDDTHVEAVTVAVDEGKAVSKEHAARVVKWLPAQAFANGRYAAMRDKDRRMYLFDVGEKMPAPAPAAPAPR